MTVLWVGEMGPDENRGCGVGYLEVTPRWKAERQPRILHCVQDDNAVGGGSAVVLGVTAERRRKRL